MPRGISRLSLLRIATLMLLVSGCNWIGVASVSSSGLWSNGDSETTSLSSNGHFVAFDSTANNLVPGDTNASVDVFVRDIAEGLTTRISVSSTGVQGNDASGDPSISANGRFVAFWSRATNLVPNDTNNQPDIFVHDRNTLTTTRVSVDSAGNEQNANCYNLSLSSDGRYVAFESEASNLVPLDTNNWRDVFVHDRNTGITTRVSVDSAGSQTKGGSNPRISANGRYVTFDSAANDIVPGDNLYSEDIFVHDRNTGITTRVSVDSAGNQANGDSWYPAISADGRYITFMSFASNLVASDTNGRRDIFVHDRNTAVTTRVSVGSGGAQANGENEGPQISGDGRYVTFSSTATNLVAGDANGKKDVFIRDRNTGKTRRASLDSQGTEANGNSDEIHAISADGRYVAIASWATNLVPNDMNGERDIFVRAIPHLTINSITPKMLPRGATTRIVIHGSDFFPGTTLSVNDATLSNYIVWNETAISADVTVPANKPAGARDVTVTLNGTGAGPSTGSAALCAACVTFF